MKGPPAGFSTLEALVALCLLGIVAAALVHGLTRATAARLRSSRQMMATQRAVSIVEQLRSGDRDIEAGGSGLEHRWSIQPVAAAPGLWRYRVSVGIGGEHLVTLEGLTWQHP